MISRTSLTTLSPFFLDCKKVEKKVEKVSRGLLRRQRKHIALDGLSFSLAFFCLSLFCLAWEEVELLV